MSRDQERTDLVPAAEALSLILEGAGPGSVERLPLRQCHRRILAEDIAALRTQPPFNASAMDGYAVRAADLATIPVALAIIGESAAGRPFAGTVGPMTAVRIFTGAPVPDGADCVIIQENTTKTGSRVVIEKAAPAGSSIRVAGLDFRQGDILLRRGDMLDPQRIALAASMNHPTLPVWRKPRIALAATGDELREPGSELAPGQIIASNTYAIAAVIEAAGGEIVDLGIIRDTPQSLDAAFAMALAAGVDAIITTGGASVGDHDLVKPAFARFGARFAFTKIAMRPGKPLIAGRVTSGGRTVHCLGLAGNPVSSLIASHVFVRPLITALAGHAPAGELRVQARLGALLPANGDREDHVRASARHLPDGTLEVTAFNVQDSSMLGLLARSDAIIIRPPHAPAAAAGDTCTAVLLRPLA